MTNKLPHNQPLILGFDQRTNNYPLIEILGTMDLGKNLMAEQIAKKLGAAYFSYPYYNVTKSGTGRTLLEHITDVDKAKLFTKEPYWWFLLYIANMYETKELIQEQLKIRPVVVLNYTTAVKIYSNSFGDSGIRTMVNRAIGELPTPAERFNLIGNPDWSIPGNVPCMFDSLTKMKLQQHITNYKLCESFHLSVDDNKFLHVLFNNTSNSIVKRILAKYPKIKEHYVKEYTHFEFTRK